MPHNSENCYVLNKQKKSTTAQTQQSGTKRVFTKKGLRQEINLLCLNAPKGKILDQYLSVIHKEKDKLKKRAKRHKKSKAAAVPSQDFDTDSDSDVSVNLMELSPTKKHKPEKEPVLSDYEQSEEEKAYLMAIHADDPDSSSETWQGPMGHSLNSKQQLNVYDNTPSDLECYASMATIIRPTKKAKTQPTLSTITLGILHSKKNSFKKKHQKRVKFCLTLVMVQLWFTTVWLGNYPYRWTDRPTGVQRLVILELPRPVNWTLQSQLSMSTET